MDFSRQYLTYFEYKELGGTLPETPLNLLEFEARRKIDERTQGRLKKTEKLPQEVKLCDFTLINSINSYSSTLNSSNKNITSENTDGYSVSYINSTQVQEVVKSKNKELEDIIMTYLLNVVINNEHILYLGAS